MEPAAYDIDGIVRDVLSRLASGAKSSSANRNAGQDKDDRRDELALRGSVVALADVEGRLEGVRRLAVPAGAVVTPSVRDRLRAGGIALVRRAADRNVQNTKIALTVAVAETTYNASPLVAALASEGLNVGRENETRLARLVERLSDRLTTDHDLAVLLTGEPAAAHWLANRRPNVRAAIGNEQEAIAAAVRSIGANLLVVDPAGKSVTVLRRLVRGFCKPGARACPTQWTDALDRR